MGSSLTECVLVGKDFFLRAKTIRGKRESVSPQHSVKIDEQWECRMGPLRDKNEGTYRGEEGTAPVTGFFRLSLRVNKAFYELSCWKVKNDDIIYIALRAYS